MSMNKRKTVGLVIDWIGTDYHRTILSGVSDFYRGHDTNLVVFVTGRIGATLESEYCRNVVLDKIGTVPLDGIIIATSSITNLDSIKNVSILLEKLPPCPVVSLDMPLGKHPTIQQDPEFGMRSLLEHVYEVHAARRFAVLRGPVNNPDAEYRWRIFCDFMDAHGLPVEEDLVWMGNFRYSSGVLAGRSLSLLRNRWDMIVSANDLMAAGVLEFLGPHTPIIGFDNLETAIRYNLTTVDANIAGIVFAACKRLEKSMNGGGSPSEDTSVPEKIPCLPIIRTSCGCASNYQNSDTDGINLFVSGGEDKWLEQTTDLGEAILSTSGSESLISCLAQHLSVLNIHHWHISLNKDDPEVLPESFLSGDKPVEIMIQSLFINRTLYGFCVFDLSSREWALFEWLRHHISLALHSNAFNALATFQPDLITQSDFTDREELMPKKSETPFDSLPVWILELDRSLRIRYTNAAGEMLFGIDEASLFGRDFFGRVHPADKDILRDAFQNLNETSGKEGYLVRIMNCKSESLPVFCFLQELSGLKIAHSAGNGSSGFYEVTFRVCGFNMKPFLHSMSQPDNLLFDHFSFTGREKEIIQGMLAGFDIRSLAKRLSVSENTVKGYMHNVYVKTGVNNKHDFFQVLRQYQKSHIGPHSFMQNLLSSFLYPDD